MRFVSPARPTVTGAVTETLRVLEERLLRGRREAALRNAWTAVQEDRERSAARTDAERKLQALAPPPPAPLADETKSKPRLPPRA